MTEINFEELKGRIENWAEERGIIKNSSPQAQFMKTVSEMGELSDAISKKDGLATIDAVGDVLVCLINMCAIMELDMVGCLASAYMEIKDRKGYLNENGVFVKEENE